MHNLFSNADIGIRRQFEHSVPNVCPVLLKVTWAEIHHGRLADSRLGIVRKQEGAFNFLGR